MEVSDGQVLASLVVWTPYSSPQGTAVAVALALASGPSLRACHLHSDLVEVVVGLSSDPGLLFCLPKQAADFRKCTMLRFLLTVSTKRHNSLLQSRAHLTREVWARALVCPVCPVRPMTMWATLGLQNLLHHLLTYVTTKGLHPAMAEVLDQVGAFLAEAPWAEAYLV